MTSDYVQDSNNYGEIQNLLRSIDSKMNLIPNIDTNLQNLINGRGMPSQGQARDNRNTGTGSGDSVNSNRPFGQHHANFTGGRGGGRNGFGDFLDALEERFIDEIGGSRFKSRLRHSLETFADTLGVDVNDLGNELGKQYGKMLANNLKNTRMGQNLTAQLKNATDQIFSHEGGINNFLDKLKNGDDLDLSFLRENIGQFADSLGGAQGTIIKGATDALGALDSFTMGVGGTVVVLLAAKQAMKGLTTIAGGLIGLFDTLGKASNRYYASREKNLELANERFKKDVETLITEPFEILKKSADEVYQAWNSNIRLIAGTQGYTKADLQDLMSLYAQRLQNEGLGNTVAATDVYNNLAKVIQAGLSGNAAVEFAYQATKYNAAIPTQDFFGFVDTYASVAANAIAAGKSENEALQIANKSLADFSNSLLYASRNLVGGYSTGLKAAESVYSSAVKISQAAKTDNLSNLSSTLLAIQGYVGSIAPDLANSISDKIYQIATGGNNSTDLVALRSLAGINASNTEFLRALANNPQSILSSMFQNLGKMYTQSPDAYMEKAEGYAALFGLSAEALQRIDFQALSNAILNMNSASSSLEENMKMLQSGETTTSTDQLKIAQINKYMVEEGLAYVIDNEAAQMIQQHMWDEQMQREMMEATYGVEIVGGVAMAIEKIQEGVQFILNILNPISWFGKLADVIETSEQANDLQGDIKGLLENTVVGKGRNQDLRNLLDRNADLKLTQNLVDMLGGQGRYGNSWYQQSGIYRLLDGLSHPVTGLYDLAKNATGSLFYGNSSTSTRGSTAASELPDSNYTWGSISKSSAAMATALLRQTSGAVEHKLVQNAAQVASASVNSVKEKIDRMISDSYLVDQYASKGKSYRQWLNSGKQFGINDMTQAIQDAGYDPDSLESYYLAKQTESGMNEKLKGQANQDLFYQTGIQFWNTSFWDNFANPVNTNVGMMTSRVDAIYVLHTEWRDSMMSTLTEWKDSQLAIIQESLNHQLVWKDSQLVAIQDVLAQQINWQEYFNTTWNDEFVGESGYFTKFFDEFVKKFIENTYYNESGYKYSDVTDVQRREKAQQGDAVMALADALTGNMVDLKDPQVQTNALLSQILIVVSAIMNQNNGVIGTTNLADTLSGLAVGLTQTTPITESPVRM